MVGDSTPTVALRVQDFHAWTMSSGHHQTRSHGNHYTRPSCIGKPQLRMSDPSGREGNECQTSFLFCLMIVTRCCIVQILHRVKKTMLAMASNDKDAVANDRTGTPLSWNSHAWSYNDSVVAGINNIYRRQIAMVVIATRYNDVPVLNHDSTTSSSFLG